MIEALTLNRLHQRISDRYEFGEQRIVGIMMARYDLKVTKEIIEQCYQYWDLHSRYYFDVYWAGYGAYLSECDESSTKTILKYPGNQKRVYFDLEAFIEIEDQFNNCFHCSYDDTIQLILVNYRNGKLHFNESIKFDLEKNIDANYATIRKMMAFLTNECRSEHNVESIVKKIKLNNIINNIKGISISEVINTAIGIAGLV